MTRSMRRPWRSWVFVYRCCRLLPRALLILCGPGVGPLPDAHDQRRLDMVDQGAGVRLLHHCDPPSGHLDATRGRRAPLGEPTRQRSCQPQRGRPRPRAAQDLHQQQPGYLRGGPGDGGQGGPPPRRGRCGGSGQLEGTPGGIFAVHLDSSLRQRHCRSAGHELEGTGGGRGPLLPGRRTRGREG